MTIRRFLFAMFLAFTLAPLQASAEENLYQKRNRLNARREQIGREWRTLTDIGKEKAAAHDELGKAIYKARERYFIQTLSMGTNVIVNHLLPSGGTLAKAILRKIVSENTAEKFATQQRRRRQIIREMGDAILALEDETKQIVEKLKALKRELDDIQSEIARINKIIENGPPGAKSVRGSGGGSVEPAENDNPESLAASLSKHFTKYMVGNQGAYRMEYTHPWHFNKEKQRFECNYRLWRIKPRPGENPRTFREHVESANENTLRPVNVSLSGAKQIVRAGKWLR